MNDDNSDQPLYSAHLCSTEVRLTYLVDAPVTSDGVVRIQPMTATVGILVGVDGRIDERYVDITVQGRRVLKNGRTSTRSTAMVYFRLRHLAPAAPDWATHLMRRSIRALVETSNRLGTIDTDGARR